MNVEKAFELVALTADAITKHRELTTLTKREQFALAAMQGLLACYSETCGGFGMFRKRVPALAREIADEMLRELAEPPVTHPDPWRPGAEFREIDAS